MIVSKNNDIACCVFFQQSVYPQIKNRLHDRFFIQQNIEVFNPLLGAAPEEVVFSLRRCCAPGPEWFRGRGFVVHIKPFAGAR